MTATTQAKRVLVVIAGTEGKVEKPVNLLPGTKPRDVLAQLGLNGYQLSRPGPAGGAYGPNDDLFGSVEEGGKVWATKADVEFGNSTQA